MPARHAAMLSARFCSLPRASQIVQGRENARKVVDILMANPDVVYGCDTEVSELDLKVNQIESVEDQQYEGTSNAKSTSHEAQQFRVSSTHALPCVGRYMQCFRAWRV